MLVTESTLPAPTPPSGIHERDHARPPSGVLYLWWENVISRLVLPPPPPRVSHKPRRRGAAGVS